MTTSKHIWNPQDGNVKCKNFVKAVNIWIMLSENVENTFIQMCLFKFIDMHLYNIHQVETTGNFVYEELIEDSLTDMYMPKVIMDVLPPSKPAKDKNRILHTLSKALPQRCQIRNLKDIILGYVNEDDIFFKFLLEVIKHSLFGSYEHCKVRLNFQGRTILYKSFNTQLNSKPFFTKWFRNGDNHQVLIFFCLKEYLIHTVRQVSPMYEIVDKMYGWSKFDEQVCNFMNKIRVMLNNISRREYNFMNLSDWISNVESVLLNASKSHIKLFRTTPQITYYTKVKNQLTKFFVEKEIFKTYETIPPQIIDFLWAIMQRLKNFKNIFKIMHLFNIPEEIAQRLINKTFSPEHFTQQSEYTLRLIIEFCRIIDLRRNIGFYILPEHLYKSQLVAMQKRESLEKLTKKDLDILGINYVCLICHDVKMFLMKTNCNSSRHSNKLAKGSLRVIVNNCSQNGNLQYVCGRRCERHQRHGKRKWKDDRKIAQRKIIKEKQREATSHRCIETPLQELSMLGHCLMFYNKIIHICTNCGNTCLINNTSFNKSVELNCSMCIQSSKKKCEKCSNLIQCNEILVLDTQTAMFRTANICQNCTTIYAQVQPIQI